MSDVVVVVVVCLFVYCVAFRCRPGREGAASNAQFNSNLDTIESASIGIWNFVGHTYFAAADDIPKMFLKIFWFRSTSNQDSERE